MKLIVGLGNPGKEYNNTRHNIGFIALDNYIKNPDWKENSYAYYINLKTNKDNILFIKPKTYMNLSGNAVSYFVNYYKINKNDILVIQDDLDLELGKIKLKYNKKKTPPPAIINPTGIKRKDAHIIPMYISSKPARIIIAIPKSIKLLPNIIFFIMLFLHSFRFVAQFRIQIIP